MVQKYVDEKIQEKPQEERKDGKFDTITKLTGSLNAKVKEKLEEHEKQ